MGTPKEAIRPETKTMPRKERAAARGHTWDPWPCCEADVDESRSHRGRSKKDTLCPACTALIALGKTTRARASEAGQQPFKWVERYHDWPGYHGHYYFKHEWREPNEPYDAGDLLRRKMFALVNVLGRPTGESAWRSNAPTVLACKDTPKRIAAGYQATVILSMDPIVQAALNDLDEAVRTALASAYREGKERGQNILLNLAGNEMSVKDFNRKTTED